MATRNYDVLANVNEGFKKTEQSILELKKIWMTIKYQCEIYEELFAIYKELLLKNNRKRDNIPFTPIPQKRGFCCGVGSKHPKNPKPTRSQDYNNKILVYSVACKNVQHSIFIFTKKYKALQNILDLCKKNKELDILSFNITTSYADKEIACDDTIDVVQKELMTAANECENICGVYKQLLLKTS